MLKTSNIDIFFVTSFLYSLKFVWFQLIGHIQIGVHNEILNIFYDSVFVI